MSKIAIIRCEKNMNRCPLTGCFKSLASKTQGFAGYEESELAGVFTCHCPGDDAVGMAKILKSKGAEAIHFCTCLFSKKGKDGWDMTDGGFCEDIDQIIARVQEAVGIPCVKGTAHLPQAYEPEVWR